MENRNVKNLAKRSIARLNLFHEEANDDLKTKLFANPITITLPDGSIFHISISENTEVLFILKLSFRILDENIVIPCNILPDFLTTIGHTNEELDFAYSFSLTSVAASNSLEETFLYNVLEHATFNNNEEEQLIDADMNLPDLEPS